MLDQIEAGLNLFDRFKRWRESRATRSNEVESISERFIRLFEAHGVHRNQIPRFIGHGLTLSDVQDEAALLAKLDETLLEAVCEKFAVRREWLDGAESQVYTRHDFYKKPRQFLEFVLGLKASGPVGGLSGVLIVPEKALQDASALLVLQECIGTVGEKDIYRYHLCNNWVFPYWKARAYLAACVGLAWAHDVYIHGVYLPNEEIENLSQGDRLLAWEGEGIWKLGTCRWHPEDMASDPEAFLKDIDPELDNYGITSALRLWLELDADGLMGNSEGNDSRIKFEAALKEATKAG